MSSPRGAEVGAAGGSPTPDTATRRFALRALLILWPAFVMAGVLEAMVFAVIDPGALHDLDAQPLRLSPSAVYSLTFLIFWAAIAASAAITQLLETPVAAPKRLL